MTVRRLIPISLVLVGLAACASPQLDTRTFELSYLDVNDAASIIDPYVYGDRPDAPGMVSGSGNVLTVRETPDNLDKIARVLEQFDRPQPRVQLRFQLIEADGNGGSDPAIADIEAELRRLFRFEGYRLAAEAYLGGAEGSSIEQAIGSDQHTPPQWILSARIHEVRARGDSGIVRMTVGVRSPIAGGMETALNARAGQTVIVGNAELQQGGGTIILAVTPELVAQ
ncbi:MAG: secretin N-terminal domain-containing protein [Gemmatimonadales bacterium]|jgi:hypothetical protein